MRVWPGQPYPLGATWDGHGVNFAIFSENATSVFLSLFARAGDANETETIALRERTDHIWHCYLPDVQPGQLYGYRVAGPYDPPAGNRFNPAKLLIDPYARAISNSITWNSALLGYREGAESDTSPDPVDSAGFMPKCVVVDPTFDWGNDRSPRIPWNRTVIYEAHVKGMTKLHPDVPEKLRGTYLGLCSDPMIEHLLALGVTAVELLPVHQHVIDMRLAKMGLSNYWGYNTIGFFAPDVRFASNGPGSQVEEFKTMVKTLHAAGLEVILDVVYNHTGEGHHLGPTLSLRGIDNRTYYRLKDDDKRVYVDYTGTGNSLNVQHPRAVQLIMDSLRYWASEMHVDGFRFDLAPVLGRDANGLSQRAAFFDNVHQDPTLANVKLIAEPWDVGPNGYQAGNFPMRWAEWNAEYRDSIRHYWRGDEGRVADLATRLAGSSDLYAGSGRGPCASINFITAHDGFTLRDVVSYERKHNEANGEENRDGHDDNVSRNWGVEGDTDDLEILGMRFRVVRDMLATLAFSQGVPMISHGDEIGRTQRGNNNAYAQDNELTWIDWNLSQRQRRLLAFTRVCFKIRHSHPSLRRRRFFRGEPTVEGGAKDVTWIRVDGREMTGQDWASVDTHAIGMLVAGDATDETDDNGRPMTSDTLLLLFNSSASDVAFAMPAVAGPGGWFQVVDTASRELREPTSGVIELAPFALALMRFGAPRMFVRFPRTSLQ
ncbi:MAG: glycogen debranching protein GlgX [Gemmatimonadaceae bacterium]